MEVVKAFEPGIVYMGRFKHGADIITELERFCDAQRVHHAWVHCIGALRKATISYYEQEGHKYVTKTLEGEYEIISCSGNISIKDGKPFAHLHIALSDTRYETFSGHLMPGTVELFAGEFVIHSLNKLDSQSEDLIRQHDDTTGLHLWASCPMDIME